jgi:hypothetical protein
MGLLDDFLSMLGEQSKEKSNSAKAVLGGWLEFVYQQAVAANRAPPMPVEQFMAAFADPWFHQADTDSTDATAVINWAQSHAGAPDCVGEDTAWLAWMQKLADASLGRVVKGFPKALVIGLGPLAGSVNTVRLARQYGLADAGTLLGQMSQIGLLDSEARRRFRHHQVLTQPCDDAESLLKLLASDYADVPALAHLKHSDLKQYWESGNADAAFLNTVADAVGAADAEIFNILSTGTRRHGLALARHLKRTVAKIVFAENDVDGWQTKWERLLWMTAPLAEPLTLMLAFDISDSDLERPVRNWEQSRANNVMQASEALASGASPYTDARDALIGASVDLDKATAPLRHASDARVRARQLCCAVIAGMGQRAHAEDDSWWVNTVINLAGGNFGQDRNLALIAQPFSDRLKAQPVPFATRLDTMEDYALECLWQTFGLASAALSTPALYDTVEDHEQLRRLWVNDEVAQIYPDGWLRHAKRMYEVHGVFGDRKVRTAPVMEWYWELLPKLEDRNREDVIKAIASTLDTPALVKFIRDEYDNGEEYPNHQLFEGIGDFDVLTSMLGWQNPHLRSQAASRLAALCTREDQRGESQPNEELWPRFLELCKKHADLFCEHPLYTYADKELERWALLWEHASLDSSRQELAESFLRGFEANELGNHAATIVDKLFSDHPGPFRAAVDEFYEDNANTLATAIAKFDFALLRAIPKLCLIHLGQSTWFGDARDELDAQPLNRALEKYPDELSALDEKSQVKLLPYLSDSGLVACTEAVAALLQKSKAKTLSMAAAGMLSRVSISALRDSGLLDSKEKNIRYTLNRGLALSTQQGASELVAERLADKANDDYIRGLMLDRLEQDGIDVSDMDPWGATSVEDFATAAHSAKIPKAIATLWNARFTDLFEPLGEDIGLMTLATISTDAAEQLPRKARVLLERLPPATRQDLAAEATNIWISENGTDKVAWLMQLVPLYGDDRCADALTKAVKDWNKKRKQKANQATHWMARMHGNYAPSQIRSIYENTRYSESIIRTAKEALQEAARNRGMEMQDLLDQLVPDFGMTSEGLPLDLGPYQYLVKVLPDLSLRIINEAGKSTKSLPKKRAEEDDGLRGLADNQFKALRKGLKPLAKAQTKQLSVAILAGKAWKRDVWENLYLRHPVLCLIGQAITWSGLAPDGSIVGHFRPTEDGTCINTEDESVALEAMATIRATHPADLEEVARAAWIAHFSDYEVVSPIGQWDLNSTLPAPDAVDEGGRLLVKQGYVIPRGSFGSLLERFGYAKGHSGDGGRINDHMWRVNEDLWVTINHTSMSAWFEESEEIAIESFEVRDRDGLLGLGKIPTSLLAGIVGQADELALKGSGFNSGWRSLY